MRFTGSFVALAAAFLSCLGRLGIALGAEQFVVRTWQAEDGLPQNSGTAIAQTPDGYLWVGTFHGLVRFNGVGFTRFTIGNTKELPSGDINELYTDRAGCLWIGTDGGLASYEHGQFKHWRTPEKLGRTAIFHFAETREGDLIVTTSDGVWRVANGQAVEISVPDAGWPTASSLVAAGPDHQVWLAHNRDLYRLDGNELQPVARMGKPIGLLTVGRDGAIWHREEGRMMRRKPSQPPQEAEFDVGKVTALVETRDGDLWVGSSERGLFHWRHGKITAVTTADGLGSNRILTLMEDREGNVWVGTDGGGFSRVTAAQLTTYTSEHGITFPDVMSIAEDRAGRIWLGTFGGSLCVGEDGRWQRFPALGILDENETIGSLWAGRDGTLWVGRYSRSLCRLRDGRPELEPRSHVSRIRALFEDRDGRLWIGTALEGVECLEDGRSLRFTTANGLSDNRITAMAQDASGTMWIGTGNGLNGVRSGKIAQVFGKRDFGSSQVHCLYADREGALWIGTPGAGITRYREGKFATATTGNGLPNDVIGQIMEDDQGHLWIGSATGVFRVNKQALHRVLDGQSGFVRSTAYGRKDGMRAAGCPGSFQPMCAKTRDGRLWFCTSAGVTVVDPNNLRRAEVPPPVHVERVLADGVELSARGSFAPSLASALPEPESEANHPPSPSSGNSAAQPHPRPLQIPRGVRRLEFHCAALSFADPEQAQFRFWLEGYEDTWQEAGARRVAYYTGVPPGGYRFHVKAANADGLWNEADAALVLVIRPTWHQSPWFRGAVMLSGLLALLAVYRLKVGALHEARAQQAAFSRRLIESQEAERKRVAADLHDSLGQSLLVINNRSKLALNEPAAGSTEEQLRQISALAAQAIEEVRAIAQNLRPYQLDRLGLTRALQFLLQNVSSSSAIRVVDEIDPVDNLLPRETEIHLFRIAQEFLSNAVKYSGATEVRVSIRRAERKVVFSFEDNGRGFDLQMQSAAGGQGSGLGLQSMTERLRILGSKFEFQSQPGRGARLDFTLAIPIREHGAAT